MKILIQKYFQHEGLQEELQKEQQDDQQTIIWLVIHVTQRQILTAMTLSILEYQQYDVLTEIVVR